MRSQTHARYAQERNQMRFATERRHMRALHPDEYPPGEGAGGADGSYTQQPDYQAPERDDAQWQDYVHARNAPERAPVQKSSQKRDQQRPDGVCHCGEGSGAQNRAGGACHTDNDDVSVASQIKIDKAVKIAMRQNGLSA